MNLYHRHHFGFVVVGKLKLIALNPKVSIFVLQCSIVFWTAFRSLCVCLLFSFSTLAWSGFGFEWGFPPPEKVSVESIPLSVFNFPQRWQHPDV